MNDLSLPDKAFLEKIFNMGGGYVLDFSNPSFETFFNELNIGIYDDTKYPNNRMSDSKANRLRAFWESATNNEIALSLESMAGYIENKKEEPVIWGDPPFSNISAKHLARVREIAQNVRDNKVLSVDPIAIDINSPTVAVTTKATVTDNKIQVEIHKDIYDHIKQYLDNKDYFHAVEESYKLVRIKLKEITGKERAHEAFSEKKL